MRLKNTGNKGLHSSGERSGTERNGSRITAHARVFLLLHAHSYLQNLHILFVAKVLMVSDHLISVFPLVRPKGGEILCRGGD